MRFSLRYRLLVPLLILLVGDFAATGWAAWIAAKHAQERNAAQLRTVARTLTEPPTFPLSGRVLEQMKSLSGAEFLFVRRDGSQITTFPDDHLEPPKGVHSADELGLTELGPTVILGEQEYQCLKLVLKPPHPNEGGTLYIFYPESLRKSAAWEAARPLLLLGGLGGVIGVGLVIVMSRKLVRDIEELNHRTRRIAAGDFQLLPLPNPDDEIRDLYQAVNDMAHRLAEFQDALQRAERLKLLGQFSGGLAHQLRNAAAGARLAVQLHVSECRAEDRESLQVALRQLTRIESNLKQFLDLGHQPAVRKEPCDLKTLIAQCVDFLKPQALHTGSIIHWQPPQESTQIQGDSTLLGHAIQNIIGNALEAAGPKGEVEIRLHSTSQNQQSFWVIEVSDNGPGPPSSIAKNLFEPFVTGKEQGIGLGLAVAKQAVENHGGTITWQRCADRTIFRIELPMPAFN